MKVADCESVTVITGPLGSGISTVRGQVLPRFNLCQVVRHHPGTLLMIVMRAVSLICVLPIKQSSAGANGTCRTVEHA